MPGLYQFVIGKTEHKEDDYKDDKIQSEASVIDKQAIAAKYVNHNELADAKEIQDDRVVLPKVYEEKCELVKWLKS